MPMNDLYSLESSPPSAQQAHRSTWCPHPTKEIVPTTGSDIKLEPPSAVKLPVTGSLDSATGLKVPTRSDEENAEIPGLLFMGGDHVISRDMSQTSTSSLNLVVMDDVFFTPTPERGAQGHCDAEGLSNSEREGVVEADNLSSISKPPILSQEAPQKPAVRFASTPPRSHPGPLSSKASAGSTEKSATSFEYQCPAPTTAVLLDSWGPVTTEYRDPHYSNPEDVPEHGRTVGDLYFHLEGGDGLPLKEWRGTDEESPSRLGTPDSASGDAEETQSSIDTTGITGWEYASAPPGRQAILRWLRYSKDREEAEKKRRAKRSQVGCLRVSHQALLNRYSLKGQH
jgi:hypothetical protein